MSWFNSQPVNDIERGREAMKFYHNACVGLGAYKESLDSLIKKVALGGDSATFLEGLGFAINSIGMSTSQVQDAMENVANQSQGRLPANQNVFFKALSDRTINMTAGDWVGVLPEIAGNVAIDIAKGTAQVGDAVLDLGKSLLTVGPVLILGAIIFIGYARTRQIAGR